VFRFRSILVCLQLLVALIATTSAAVGCEHCWHYLSDTKSGLTIAQAGDDSSGDAAEHVCVCTCSHGFTLPEIMPQDYAAPVSLSEIHPLSFRTVPQSPPLLPPKA